MDSAAPIRSRAPEEGNFEIPLWGVPLVLLIVYVCLFNGLGALGLVGPDEPRYAAIARAMAETHDWITPRLWGSPWFEKPVLYYWCAGIAMRLFGVSEFAARLPSALAALLAVAAVTWTALRTYGLGAAWYSLLMLPTCVGMIGFSRAAAPDMLFAGFLTASMAVAVQILQKSRPGPILQIAFGVFLGAAVLAKGPAAIILAGGATLVWAAISRHWLAPFRFLHPLIVAAFCVTALPWYVLCALRNPDFLRVFIWQHNFERYLTPVFQHPQPVWFYGPIFALALFPWCVTALGALGIKRESSAWQTSPTLFVACWTIFPLLFFSFSESKLPGYILPAVPPALLLLGRSAGLLFARGGRWPRLWMGITGAVFAVIAAAPTRIIGSSQEVDTFASTHIFWVLYIGVIGGLVVLGLSGWGKPRCAVIALALVVSAIVFSTNIGVLPYADPQLSARPLARYSLALMSPSADAAVYGLTREWNYGLSYYFGRELPAWAPGQPLPEWLFTSDSNAAGFLQRGARLYKLKSAAETQAVLVHLRP